MKYPGQKLNSNKKLLIDVQRLLLSVVLLTGITLSPCHSNAATAITVKPVIDRLTELYSKDEIFEIEDRRMNPEVLDRFLSAIGKSHIYDLAIEKEEWTLGKKRCTKWSKKGRRFCVQRIGFLHWKFGTEHNPN